MAGIEFQLIGEKDIKIKIPKEKDKIETQILEVAEIIKRTKDKKTKAMWQKAMRDLEEAIEVNGYRSE